MTWSPGILRAPWRIPCLALTVVLPVTPLPVTGQTITGRVQDEVTGAGLSTAFVEVLDEASERIGAALTDRSGGFRVTLERAGGPFRLELNTLSHRGVRVDSLQVDAGQVLELGEIRLEMAPIVLDGVVAEAQRSRITLGREAVRRHQMLGRGTFLAGAVIGIADPPSLAQYIAQASGLWIAEGGTVLRNPHSRTGDECVIVKVNRWPLNRPGFEPGEPPIGFRNLDDVPLDWIAAIEVYNDYHDVPGLYSSDAIADGIGSRAQYCGYVNIWLTNSWF